MAGFGELPDDDYVTLSHVTFGWAWQQAGLGPPHPVIGDHEWWFYPDHYGRVVDACMAELTAAGFWYRGKLVREFEDTLLDIARADYECYAFMTKPSGWRLNALTAVHDNRAVNAVQQHDKVHLEDVDLDDLIQKVAVEMPDDTSPSSGATLTRPFFVPRNDYDPQLDPGTYREAYELERPDDYATPSQVERLAEIMQDTRTGLYQYVIAVRRGGQRVTSNPITVIDTVSHGRIVTYLRHEDLTDVIACAPSNDLFAILGETLDDMLSR